MEPIEAMWAKVLGFLPNLLAAIVILVVGCLLATFAQKIITRFLKLARLDTVSEKTGIANVLTKGDINYTLAEIIGVLIYWLITLIVILATLNALQLTIAAELLNQVIFYIPSVIASIFILVLGIFFASIVGNAVRTAAANAGIHQARSLGQAAQVIIAVLVALEALKQLQIDTAILDFLLQAILVALALGVGLAIGLGCKDMAAKYVTKLVDSFKAKK
jgi:hypothetical protein